MQIVETYYDRDGQPDAGGSDKGDELGFTVAREVETGKLTADLGQFYSKFGSCKIVATPDITEAEFAVAVGAFVKALPGG